MWVTDSICYVFAMYLPCLISFWIQMDYQNIQYIFGRPTRTHDPWSIFKTNFDHRKNVIICWLWLLYINYTSYIYIILIYIYYTYPQQKQTPGFSTHPVGWKPNVVIEEDLLDFVVRKHLRVFFDYAQEPGGSFKTWKTRETWWHMELSNGWYCLIVVNNGCTITIDGSWYVYIIYIIRDVWRFPKSWGYPPCIITAIIHVGNVRSIPKITMVVGAIQAIH